MNLSFTKLGWAHFTDWFTNQRILKKINALVEDILRNGPLQGTGKPERLKYLGDDIYSRRIDDANRLVYEYDEINGLLIIVSCKGHYEE
jgi:toxin YoeB